MKQFKLSLSIVMALFAIVFLSCKKDETAKASTITYNGVEYDLTKGYIINLGATVKAAPAVYGFAVFLASSGITMETYAPPTGTGNALGIWLYSSSQTDIAPGTYTYGNTVEALKINEGFVMLESSYSALKSLPQANIVSGTLVVAVNEAEYEFTFTGTITGGAAVSAYYKGTLISIQPTAPAK
jgi:hypothetical protein